MCKGTSQSSKAIFSPDHWDISMHRPKTSSVLKGCWSPSFLNVFTSSEQTQMYHGDHLPWNFLIFSLHLKVGEKPKKTHLFLPAVLATPILRVKNKTCLWKHIDRMITCFKGSQQLIGWKTDKIKANQQFPWGHCWSSPGLWEFPRLP